MINEGVRVFFFFFLFLQEFYNLVSTRKISKCKRVIIRESFEGSRHPPLVTLPILCLKY